MSPKKPAPSKSATASTTPKPPAPSKPQPSKKRKSPPSSTPTTSAPPAKVSRRSARTAPPTPSSKTATLQYLLSPQCLSLVRPKDEAAALSENNNLETTYASAVPLPTPFAELLAALILSRPISHALGQRSIRTLLNPPFGLSSPEAIRKAGREKVHEALEVARTQHKSKTAEGVVGLADVVVERFGGGTGLEGLRYLDGKAKEERGRDGIKEAVMKEVKGMGGTGSEIFLRRVQGWWGECGPFVDGRSAGALDRLGLPRDAGELEMLIGEKWGELDTDGVGGQEGEERKRMAFVLVVERAVGGELEGKTWEILDAVGKEESRK